MSFHYAKVICLSKQTVINTGFDHNNPHSLQLAQTLPDVRQTAPVREDFGTAFLFVSALIFL